ncbi:MAG: hypothetical protein AAF401_09240 [Pseudomonadota bacterium]
MFTVEHLFDASVVTLVDEGDAALFEDVKIRVAEDHISVEQYDAMHDELRVVSLSFAQARDLQAALNLPEGSYRLKK